MHLETWRQEWGIVSPQELCHHCVLGFGKKLQDQGSRGRKVYPLPRTPSKYHLLRRCLYVNKSRHE